MSGGRVGEEMSPSAGKWGAFQPVSSQIHPGLPAPPALWGTNFSFLLFFYEILILSDVVLAGGNY